MSDKLNPYGVSGAVWQDVASVGAAGPLPDPSPLPEHRVPASIMNILEQTRSWIQFFALIGFMLAAMFVFATVFMIFGGFVMGPGSRVGSLILPGCYALAATVFAIPAHFLWHLSYWIGRASMQPTWRELEGVVRAQRLFWQVSGMLAALLICATSCLLVYSAFAF